MAVPYTFGARSVRLSRVYQFLITNIQYNINHIVNATLRMKNVNFLFIFLFFRIIFEVVFF